MILLQGLAGELVNVLREAGQIVPTSLLNFGTHVKKKVCTILSCKINVMNHDECCAIPPSLMLLRSL